jgi:hypothetical protein
MVLTKEAFLMRLNFPYKTYKVFCVFVVMLALFVCDAKGAFAQTITENAPLTFGKLVLVDNSSVKTVTLLASGSYTADPDYIFFSDPQLGNITVDGYPPFTPLSVSVGLTTLNSLGGGSAVFSTGTTFTNPAVIATDAAGSVTFDVGATLSSDGSGVIFTDNDYEGVYTITVSP